MKLLSKVEIKKSLLEGARWDTFLTEDVSKGDLVEECVVFPLSNELDGLNDYRHSENPNIEFTYLFDMNLIRIYALKDLTKGQELYKKYSCPFGSLILTTNTKTIMCDYPNLHN